MSIQGASSLRAAACALPFLAFLSACGGGGGENTGATATPVTYQTKAAIDNSQAITKTYNVSGTGSDGGAYSLTFARSPASATNAFFPTAATASAVNLIFRKAGVTVNTANSTSYSDTNSKPLGLISPDGSCVVFTNATTPAATGKAGDVITSSDATQYQTCGNTGTLIGFQTSVTTVETDAGIGLLCSTVTGKNASLVVLATTTVCIEIDAAGAIKDRAKVTVLNVAAGLTVTAKNY